ncbi:MAG: hypothetical protein JWM74_4454 [Myxococcaceae bacterium]|jgi:hypothetical protein|nr:hypothetical protein [Myxococcaceae bacterium]
MKRRIFPVLGLAAAVFALATVPASEGDATAAATVATTVVVELYTSEGCSSCPSADAVLTRLARAQSIPGARIVPLAMHVDYWDDLGWKDPFAQPQLTARQRRFSAAKGEGRVYTPEAVVDGETGLVGSDEAALRRAIEASAKRAHTAVTVARGAGDALDVRVAATGAAIEVDALLAITEDDLVVDVPRGENSGRRLEHSAVVRELRSLGAVAPTGATFAPQIGPAPRSGAGAAHRRHAVVIVEERRSRRVLGAGVLDL